jgi:ABC-type branched-subunit amino acid transport system ATPase component
VLLAGRDLTVSFGGVRALAGVSIAVDAGEIVGLVGANGAGKTTLLDCLSGHVRPSSGQVVLDGRDLTRAAPDARARRGLVRSFQDARLFPAMSVRDALLVAQERVAWSGLVGSLLSLPRWRGAERRRVAAASELAATMGLGPHLDSAVGELSTGERRAVDLACVSLMAPRVLLLDEPSAGLASAEVPALSALLTRVRDATGAGVIMVEHDWSLARSVADRLVVLEDGQVAGEPRAAS